MTPLLRYRPFPLFLLFLLITILALSFLLFFSPGGPSPGTVHIKKGMSLKQVAQALEEGGVIRNRRFFILLATVFGKKGKMKAGEYEFQPEMLPLEVLNNLVRGQVKHRLVTFPEGFTLSQIAQTLDAQKIVPKDDFFLKAASSPLISSLGLASGEKPISLLEGYLYPETYHLYREMESEEVIRMMVQQFKKIFEVEWAGRPSGMELSEHEIVILASIIEKETPLPEEKPLISAVFHNRLKQTIPLQSDPTVIYGIKDFNGNLTREDLLRPTPYNTYIRSGLPPTPICNPGRESLHAAIHPAEVPYLYFVSKNDGSHYFSAQFEEHTRAVWRYQKTGRKKELDKRSNSH